VRHACRRHVDADVDLEQRRHGEFLQLRGSQAVMIFRLNPISFVTYRPRK
jgi:hypothetical protein